MKLGLALARGAKYSVLGRSYRPPIHPVFFDVRLSKVHALKIILDCAYCRGATFAIQKRNARKRPTEKVSILMFN